MESGGQTASARGEQQPQQSPEELMLEELGFSAMDLGDLPPQLAARLNIEDTDRPGVVVTDVNRSSYAFRAAGIQPGLIIVEAAGEPIESVRDFQRIYNELDEGETFIVRYEIPGAEGSRRTALRKSAS